MLSLNLPGSKIPAYRETPLPASQLQAQIQNNRKNSPLLCTTLIQQSDYRASLRLKLPVPHLHLTSRTQPHETAVRNQTQRQNTNRHSKKNNRLQAQATNSISTTITSPGSDYRSMFPLNPPQAVPPPARLALSHKLTQRSRAHLQHKTSHRTKQRPLTNSLLNFWPI